MFSEEEYGTKEQKEDRNLFSNSLKIFLKYIRDMRELNPLALKMIIQQIDNYSMEEFYVELEKKIPKNSTYIGIASTTSLTAG
jgi:hypothetical protein